LLISTTALILTNPEHGWVAQHQTEAMEWRGTRRDSRLVHRDHCKSLPSHTGLSSACQTDLDGIFATTKNITPCGSGNRHKQQLSCC